MKTEDITKDLLSINIMELREELTIYKRDILYMGRHREAIALDKNIQGEFKHPILDCIDEEIGNLVAICKDLEEEIIHYEDQLVTDVSSFEDTASENAKEINF